MFRDLCCVGKVTVCCEKRRKYINTICGQKSGLLMLIYVVKGKAIPLQAWTGPKGSRRLRLPDFKTIGT